ALVAVVAKQTGQSSNSIDTFVHALEGRIQAMADAHVLLSQSHWRGVDIADLARRQLAPYTSKAKVFIDGPHIILSAAAAQALAMGLHELTANAVKYGALSSPHGKVWVRWEGRVAGDGVVRVAFSWRESIGPPVTAPKRCGHGTNLIRNLIPHELGGTVDLV